MTTITKADWANMQRDLSAALKRAEEAEASLALWRKEAAIAGKLRQENDALRAKLAKAEKRAEAAKQKPARFADNGALVRRLKKRIAVLEGKEPKAKRGRNGDQV